MQRRHALQWILGLALALRLIDIDAPVIGDYSWRQADTASIARNFANGGLRFLYPQIDWRGDGPGYVESELPLYPFLVAILYSVSGTHEVIARGVSVVFSIFTLIFLYWLVRESRDESTALWSCAFLAILPQFTYVSRAIMPESLLLMTSVAGILYFTRWVRSGGRSALLCSGFFISVACMVKLPALYLGLPLLYLAWLRHGRKLFWAPSFWLYGALVLIPVALWYWHAHQLFLETGLSFGIWEPGTDKWANWDLVLTREYWQRILIDRLARRILTYAAFAIFLVGLFVARKSPSERLFDYWLVGLGVYLIVVGRGNYVHDYYQLPLVLPMVVFVGKVFSRFARWPFWRAPVPFVLATTLVITLAASAQRMLKHHERVQPEHSVKYALAERLAGASDPADRVIVIDGGDPTVLYLAGRTGWRGHENGLSAERVEGLIRRGAAYAVGVRKKGRQGDRRDHLMHSLMDTYSTLESNDDFYIVRLR